MKNTYYYSLKSKTTIGLFCAFLALANACKKSSTDYAMPATTQTTATASNDVLIQNTAFNSSSITVAVNSTVKWTNKDAIAHTVTSTSGLFDSGTIPAGGTFSYLFTTAGVYPYKCLIHSGMTGTVTVK